MSTHNLTMDLHKCGASPVELITVRVGDSGEVLHVDVLRDGEPADLEGCTARFEAVRPDRALVLQEMEVSGSSAEVTVDPAAWGMPGLLRAAYVRVFGPDGSSESVRDISVNVLPGAEDMSSIDAGVYVSQIDALVGSLNELRSDMAAFGATAASAEAARASAEETRAANEASRVAAELSRVSAESSRASAEASREQAEAARVAAETSRAQAESARAQAEAARASAESARVTECASAVSSASAATSAAQSAASSALSAASKATEAAGSATEAVSAAVDAIVPGAVAAEVARYVQVSWTVGEDGGLDATVYDEEE